MKKIIYVIGILLLATVIILNMLFTSYLNNKEHITIRLNSILYVACLILVGVLLFFITKKLNNYLYSEKNIKYKKEIRMWLFIVAFVLYVFFNIIWIIFINPKIQADSIHVCNLAQAMETNDLSILLKETYLFNLPLSQYAQIYPQQITLAFILSIFLKITSVNVLEFLRIYNVISNAIIFIALYKINTQLSKRYRTNKVLLFTLIITFVSIPMLATFIYGDIPSLACCLFSVYFMMRYTETKKIKHFIIASILAMIAYMTRMNSLIFILATIIYLLLSLLSEFKNYTWKKNLLKSVIIIAYILISLAPASIVKNYYINKYNLNKDKACPTISYILMAMEEGPRANGWYNNKISHPAIKNPQGIKSEYSKRIKNKLIYFVKKPGYMLKFYTKKIASMWTENTYSAVRNNETKEHSLEGLIVPLTFYQKMLLLLMSICSLVVLIQKRKSISLDVIYLITVFIGGFLFHILWEAKSRYIIPYIVVLIPIASIELEKWKMGKWDRSLFHKNKIK